MVSFEMLCMMRYGFEMLFTPYEKFTPNLDAALYINSSKRYPRYAK